MARKTRDDRKAKRSNTAYERYKRHKIGMEKALAELNREADRLARR